jgi:hypothetical protein
MRRSRKILLGLAVLWAAHGAIIGRLLHSTDDVAAAQILLGIPTSIALFSWCKSDAAERSIVAPASSALLVGSIGPIGVPIYFLRTMRFWEAMLAIIKATGFYVGIVVAEAGASYLSMHVVA